MQIQRTRAQESRAAIQRLYIAMRHLFIRGGYKPLGVSGEAMIESLKMLRPEIYGAINDPEKVELNGLLYVFERLPRGIEECRYIRLISREGFENSSFNPIVPAKRRRNCYRIDEEQMFIEMTRGRSDIYDVLTHLTFLYMEAEKIRRNSLDSKGRVKRDWQRLEQMVEKEKQEEPFDQEVAYTYLSTLLGRSFAETVEACRHFGQSGAVNSIFHITYWLGRRSMEEFLEHNDREIAFSSALRQKVGHHVYGESWAQNIKQRLWDMGGFERPLHIISANLHSVMNSFFAVKALEDQGVGKTLEEVAALLSKEGQQRYNKQVQQYAEAHGMIQVDDLSGTNLSVQIFDLMKINGKGSLPFSMDAEYIERTRPLILVMDYAFGEQAFETMDELLKPFERKGTSHNMNVASISIMGKAGILEGKKGDLMLPTAYVFEGTADNYPLENCLSRSDFQDAGLAVYQGPMITVLGTSLQNKDVLSYFLTSSWQAVGLEMEGAHYQKAIQSASRIRNSVRPDLELRYAYYASDNPLETGHTLASGSLGIDGVKPTYAITTKILEQILNPTN